MSPGGGCAAGLHHSQDLNLTSATLPKEDSNLHRPVQSRVSYQLDDRGRREHPVTGVKGCSRGPAGWRILGRVANRRSTTALAAFLRHQGGLGPGSAWRTCS